jgi:zinc protease
MLSKAILRTSILALAAAAVLAAQVRKGPTVEGITEYQLANGLKVLLFPDPSKPTVTVNVTYMVGSRHEGYGETGMAHLLEHMVCKPTKNRSNIMKELEDHGARFNGTTGQDRTNYFEVLTASDENLKWALEMEADRMVNALIAKSDLDTEMTVVRNEFEMSENSPAGVLLARVLATAFLWHNYGKVPIGNRADIENVPIERLQAFYRKYYQPDNAMLVVAGKFDPEKTLGWIQETFGKIPRPARKLDATYTQEPTQDGERSVTLRRVGDVQALNALYHVPPGTHPDYGAVQVLSSVLGEVPSGRLYKALVDTKKASSASTMDFQLKETSVLMAMAQVRKEQSLEEAERALLAVIDSMVKEPPTKEEVERAKARLLKQIELNMASSTQVGIELSEWESMGDWRMVFLNRDAIAKVTPADVERVAKAYLKRSNLTLGRFIPEANPDRSEIPAAPDVSALVKDYKGKAAMAEGEAFDPSPANIDARTKVVALPNGMKLSLLPKKTRGETVVASLSLHFGDEKSLQGRSTAAAMAGSLLMRGTRNKSRQQIQDELDRLKARMNVGADATGANASLETVRGNLPEAMRLLAEVLREPAFPDTEFEQIRNQRLSAIESQKSEPQGVAFNEMERHLSPYPKGDPRYVSTFEEMVDDFKKVTIEDARKFYADFFGASDATLAVVGDFDAAEVEKLAGELFGNWKSPKPYRRIVSKYAKPAAISRTLDTPDKANSFFIAGTLLNLNDESPDYPALSLANFLIGGSAKARLFERLRQKEGLSYAAQSVFLAQPKQEAAPFLAIAIANPANLAKLEASFRDEMKKIAAEGFQKEEFDLAQKAWQQKEQLQRTQDRAVAAMLKENAEFGRKMAWWAEIEKKVAALTLEQVNAAVKKYLVPDDLSVVKAVDLKKAGLKP